MGTLAATKQLISRVSPKTSALFVCDMQEAFRCRLKVIAATESLRLSLWN